MGLGIILSALSAGGNSVAQSVDQQEKAEIEQNLVRQRADLEQQKAMALSTFNNQQTIDTANSQRTALAARIAPTQAQIQGIIAANANKKFDYTNPDGSVSPATFDRLPGEDATSAEFQPSPRQMLQLQATNAANKGDYTTAVELNKLADSDQKIVPYSGLLVDAGNLDADGKATVLAGSTEGRDAYNQGRVANGLIRAEADRVKANNSKNGLAAHDPESVLIKEQINAEVKLRGQTLKQKESAPKDMQGRLDADLAAHDAKIADLQTRANARGQIVSAAREAQRGSGSGSGAAPAAGPVDLPPGYTPAGTSNGKPIYKDPQGNLVSSE